MLGGWGRGRNFYEIRTDRTVSRHRITGAVGWGVLGRMGTGRVVDMTLFREVINPQGEITRLATHEQNFRQSIKAYHASLPLCSRCRRKKLIARKRREAGLCAGCEKKGNYANM